MRSEWGSKGQVQKAMAASSSQRVKVQAPLAHGYHHTSPPICTARYFFNLKKKNHYLYLGKPIEIGPVVPYETKVQ